jgi:hypothetical protein
VGIGGESIKGGSSLDLSCLGSSLGSLNIQQFGNFLTLGAEDETHWICFHAHGYSEGIHFGKRMVVEDSVNPRLNHQRVGEEFEHN